MFATSGVDAPAKEITDAAGVGVGTLYRHFPRRADLIVAVLQREIDACAEAAAALRNPRAPHEALRQWVRRYVDLVGTKRGLAEALQSGDSAFGGLHDYVAERLEPVVADLLADARAAGELDAELDARELLYAVAPSVSARARGRLRRRLQPPDGDGVHRRLAPRAALAEVLGPGALGLDQVDDELLVARVGRALVLVRDPVDDLPGAVALHALVDAAADRGHPQALVDLVQSRARPADRGRDCVP